MEMLGQILQSSPAGDPTSGATGTGSAYTLTQNQRKNISVMPFVSSYSTTAKLSCNFGAGYFGTTAVATAGTNASGVGTFEFDVPTGYYCIFNKRIRIYNGLHIISTKRPISLQNFTQERESTNNYRIRILLPAYLVVKNQKSSADSHRYF